MPVALRVADDLVGGGVVERALGALGGVPLHLVLGRDHVELAVQDAGVRGVAELVRGDGGAEVAALLARPRRRGWWPRRRAVARRDRVTPPAARPAAKQGEGPPVSRGPGGRRGRRRTVVAGDAAPIPETGGGQIGTVRGRLDRRRQRDGGGRGTEGRCGAAAARSRSDITRRPDAGTVPRRPGPSARREDRVVVDNRTPRATGSAGSGGAAPRRARGRSRPRRPSSRPATATVSTASPRARMRQPGGDRLAQGGRLAAMPVSDPPLLGAGGAMARMSARGEQVAEAPSRPAAAKDRSKTGPAKIARYVDSRAGGRASAAAAGRPRWSWSTSNLQFRAENRGLTGTAAGHGRGQDSRPAWLRCRWSPVSKAGAAGAARR